MRKYIIAFLILASTIVLINLFIQNKIAQKTVELEWHDITLTTFDSIKPTFPILGNIFAEAFLPTARAHAYKYDPRLQNIPIEKQHFVKEKVHAIVIEQILAAWNKTIDGFYTKLQSKRLDHFYIAIAKNNRQEIIGFALFIKGPMKSNVLSRLRFKETMPQEIDQALGTNNEIRLHYLAVKPFTQQKGIGKALVFSVLDHCLDIKTIYLTTPASEFNKKTQGFYEHIGFKPMYLGTTLENIAKTDIDYTKIVYVYQKQRHSKL